MDNNNTQTKKTRRKLSSQFKTQLVMEYLKGSKSRADLCRENILSPSVLAKWIGQFQKNAHLIFEDQERNGQQEKMNKLEQIIGRQAVEIDFLKRGISKI